MQTDKIEHFRKSLRMFERSVELQLKQSQCCSGITLKQCHTLLMISELGECTVNELAKELKQDKSSSSRNIENLFRKEFVNRTINPENRREMTITLTEKGKNKVDEINKENNIFYSELLKQLPDDKIDTIIDSLELLSEIM